MSNFRRNLMLPAGVIATVGALAVAGEYTNGIPWQKPPVVTPGEGSQPPSDAVVLFDGSNLDAWKNAENWAVVDGVAVPKKGELVSKQSFGDMQMHVEFATPAEVKGSGQGRGNSGVYIMGLYEVQILDSYNNETYFDGQAASLYKQWPPLVNACRPPGEWQSYDIVFNAPKFNDDGGLAEPAYVTVLQNGVLVQNHSELQGGTSWDTPPAYKKHADRLPIHLQFHGNPVRFRNIWVRELKDRKPVADPLPAAGDDRGGRAGGGRSEGCGRRVAGRNPAPKAVTAASLAAWFVSGRRQRRTPPRPVAGPTSGRTV